MLLVVLHATGLLCAPLGGCLCAVAAAFIPGVTLGSGHGRTHGIFYPAFLVRCWDKQWWLASEASSCPFRLVLGGRSFHGRAGRGSTSFPGQRAELRARVGLVAIGSFSRCEEADLACIKTLGVVGTGVDAGCLTPHNGSQYPLGSIPHAVECPCPPCLCWPRGGNCQEGAALSRNHIKLELCQKYFHPSAGRNHGPCLQGTVVVWPQLWTRCYLAAQGLFVSSSDTSCSFCIHARSGDLVAEQDVT